MKKKKTKAQKQQATIKAMWKITFLFIVLGGVIFAALWWARNDDRSKVAGQLRDLLGIHPVGGPVEPAAETKASPPLKPKADAELAATPPPPAQIETPVPAEPIPMEWSDFLSKRNMWPRQLKIQIDPVVELVYRGQSFGEMSFETGQTLEVISLSKEGMAYGTTKGNEIEVHASETDFEQWFQNKHGEDYTISVPTRTRQRIVDDFEQELITNLRIWALRNYNTPLIEIGEDSLVLRLSSSALGDAAPGTDLSLEALSVARAYLRIQGELGGKDNYASAEIRDSETGRLLGSKGIFIPRL